MALTDRKNEFLTQQLLPSLYDLMEVYRHLIRSNGVLDGEGIRVYVSKKDDQLTEMKASLKNEMLEGIKPATDIISHLNDYHSMRIEDGMLVGDVNLWHEKALVNEKSVLELIRSLEQYTVRDILTPEEIDAILSGQAA